MAWRPATPAPNTNTLLGAIVPAAVTNIGKNFPTAAPAIRTALYPVTVDIEESTSIDCARLIRGSWSRLNEVTFRPTIFFTPSGSARGKRNPINTAPSRISSASWRPPTSRGIWILSTRSAPPHSAAESPTTSAPAFVYRSSGYPAATPARCSTRTVMPLPTSRFAMSGTSATRCSPSNVSLGMAIITRTDSPGLRGRIGTCKSGRG